MPRTAKPTPPSGSNQNGREALSDPRIVKAAREIVAESGVDGLTMRRLSAKLGVTLGATYRHVASKRELLLLVARDLYEDVSIPSTGPWQDRLKKMMIQVAALVGSHPGMASFMNANPDSVPVGLDRTVIQMLQEAGFDREGVEAVMGAMFFYVTGMAASGHRPAPRPGRSPADIERLFERGLDILVAGAQASLESQSKKPTRAG